MKYTLLFFCLLVSAVVVAQGEFHLDKVYKVDTQGKVKLSTDDADVYITGSDRKDIHVKIDRVVESKGITWGEKQFDVSVEVVDGDIIIRDKEWGNVSMVGYIREDYTVRIEAPATMALDIRGDDGDYEIDDMAGSIRLVADDGDILVTNFTGNSTYFDLDDGDVTMEGGTGELSINMDDGDMDISDGKFSSIEMDIDDGDVRLETTLQNDGDYLFRIEDGSLDLTVLGGGGKFDIRHDDGSIRYDGSFDVVEEDDDYSILRLAGGEALVKVRGDDTRVSLRAD